MVLQTQHSKELRVETLYFTQCGSSWSERSELTFHILKAVLLYTVPLVFMSVAYCQIVMVLWRSDNIPGHTETMNYYGTAACNNGNRIYSQSHLQLLLQVCFTPVLFLYHPMFSIFYYRIYNIIYKNILHNI
jgi:hypothetical protein